MPRDERIYPDVTNGNFLFHLFRYLWALRFALDEAVLDAGCGSGYGAALLANVARNVTAVDHDDEAVSENRVKYASVSNLNFAVSDVAELTYPEESYGLIVSFEVYEHLEAGRSEMFLGHLRRICKKGGWVLVSTPNRLVEKPFLKSAAITYKYHVNSVSPTEFRRRLEAHFPSVTLLGQRFRVTRLKGALRSLDFLNLRHSLLSYTAKKRVDSILQGGADRPQLWDIELEPSFVRQSGIIVAMCRK